MFDVGWDELLLVGIVALLVVGPRDLPKVMRVVGQWTRRVREMASHFRAGFDDMVREAEFEDYRKAAEKRALSLEPPPAAGDVAGAGVSTGAGAPDDFATDDAPPALADSPAGAGGVQEPAAQSGEASGSR